MCEHKQSVPRALRAMRESRAGCVPPAHQHITLLPMLLKLIILAHVAAAVALVPACVVQLLQLLSPLWIALATRRLLREPRGAGWVLGAAALLLSGAALVLLPE